MFSGELSWKSHPRRLQRRRGAPPAAFMAAAAFIGGGGPAAFMGAPPATFMAGAGFMGGPFFIGAAMNRLEIRISRTGNGEFRPGGECFSLKIVEQRSA